MTNQEQPKPGRAQRRVVARGYDRDGREVLRIFANGRVGLLVQPEEVGAYVTIRREQ